MAKRPTFVSTYITSYTRKSSFKIQRSTALEMTLALASQRSPRYVIELRTREVSRLCMELVASWLLTFVVSARKVNLLQEIWVSQVVNRITWTNIKIIGIYVWKIKI